jgi:3-deoxy-7-phosphoheptulonate synthase
MNISNTRIQKITRLISPEQLRKEIPPTENSDNTILNAREDLYKIIKGEDDRFIVITGPCSIHDYSVAMEYAAKLNVLRDKYLDKLYIVMRIYFEKPRTIDGWKGLIYDPFLNNTYDIESGLKKSREILIKVADMGLPTATEILDPIIAGYIGQLASWVAIGARTTESQTHRQMSSGLSAPVGFKNGTNGDIDIAINAIKTASSSHNFLGIDDSGNCSILQTSGNPYGHIVLRGGGGKPNYHIEDIEKCEERLKSLNVNSCIIVDCSHDNSKKDFKKQKIVVRDILSQKKYGNKSIKGIMLESNLFEGKQEIPVDIKQLKFGVSVTDGCMGWDETEKLIETIYKGL